MVLSYYQNKIGNPKHSFYLTGYRRNCKNGYYTDGDPVWEKHIGGDRCGDKGSGGLSSQDRNKDYGNESTERQRQGIGVGLGGRRFGGNKYLADKGVYKEESGNNNGLCIRETNIQTLYRLREDGWFH